MRLGGWQRLFVVLTMAWTLRVAVVTWQTWPPEPWRPPDYFRPVVERTAGDDQQGLTDDQVSLRALHEELADIDKRVHARRVAAARTALILWLLPPLGLYATSRASRWVYHGFRPS